MSSSADPARLERVQASFPAAQIGRMACLVRWYDFLQHTADPTGIYPRVPVPVPPLRLPVPSAAAPRVHSLSKLIEICSCPASSVKEGLASVRMQ